MAAKSGVQLMITEDGYFLRVGEEESEVADFGEPIDFKAGDKKYVGFCAVGEDGESYETPSEAFVYEVAKALTDVEPEDADGDGDDEEEEEEVAVVDDEEDDSATS